MQPTLPFRGDTWIWSIGIAASIQLRTAFWQIAGRAEQRQFRDTIAWFFSSHWHIRRLGAVCEFGQRILNCFRLLVFAALFYMGARLVGGIVKSLFLYIARLPSFDLSFYGIHCLFHLKILYLWPVPHQG
jgi:hypothetical protein